MFTPAALRSCRIVVVVLLLGFFMPATMAQATNIRTGEPCNFGVTTSAERTAVFLGWFAPPTLVAVVAALTASFAYAGMRRSRQPRQRRTRGLLVGVALAVSTVAGLAAVSVVAIDWWLPTWMY